MYKEVQNILTMAVSLFFLFYTVNNSATYKLVCSVFNLVGWLPTTSLERRRPAETGLCGLQTITHLSCLCSLACSLVNPLSLAPVKINHGSVGCPSLSNGVNSSPLCFNHMICNIHFISLSHFLQMGLFGEEGFYSLEFLR